MELRHDAKLAAEKGEDHEVNSNGKVEVKSPLVEQGPNGELCIWNEDKHEFEFWVWGSPKDAANYSDNKDEYGCTIKGEDMKSKEVILKFLTCLGSDNCVIHAFRFMPKSYGTVFIYLYSDLNGTALGALDNDSLKKYPLKGPFKSSACSLKVSSQFIVVSSAAGHLHVFQYERKDDSSAESGQFILGNEDGSLSLVQNHCTLPIVQEDLLTEFNKEDVLLKTGTFDQTPIFDLVGSWLVYAPTRLEIDYFRRLQVSNDSMASGRNDKRAVTKLMFTPVKLPLRNPLLVRMMSSLSNNAFDKLYRLSQYGTKKFRSYMSSSNKIIDKDVSLHSISNSIGKALYSTATKLKKETFTPGLNEYIKILDLSNGKIMATFKPPGGISHLSLSPYDLHLIHASYKGDNFYMWDLYKLPKEVSLVEKFARGRTSAKTKEIVWFVNDKNTETLPGTNSGFGCITKESGSVHWYNINYLFCGNETSNFPNVINTGLTQKKPSSGQFLDSWILPSNKAVKFLKLPRISNLATYKSQSNEPENGLNTLSQLSFLDSDGCIRLLSPLNGKHTFKYNLPINQPLNKALKDGKCLNNSGSPFDNYHFRNQNIVPQYHNIGGAVARKFDVPLSQTEIETAEPYMSLIKNRNVEISCYDFGGDYDGDAFFNSFATFGNHILTVQQFVTKDSGTNTPMHASGALAIDGGLEIHVEDDYQGES